MDNEMTEGSALNLIDDAMSKLETDAQRRIVGWINQKFGDKTKTGPEAMNADYSTLSGNQSTDSAVKSRKKGTHSKKKAQKALTLDKKLNLFPDGKKSVKEFAEEKNPSSITEKHVVAVYYISRVLEAENVNANQVYSVFNALKWRYPKNFVNSLHIAGTKGLLDTSKAVDLKLTPLGFNLIEHELPRQQSK